MPHPAWLLGLVFVTALGGTWTARRYALHWKLVDQPGERRSHLVATPRGGGIAIVVAMLLALSMAAFWLPAQRGFHLMSVLGLVLVAGIGWIDDHRPLSPWRRLMVHVVAAAVLGFAILQQGAPPWSALVSGLLALGLVNVWNFMDGIDGLATTQALLVALSAAWIASATGQPAFLALAVVVACLGFLPFNAPRARIFLGDVGSGALGYLLAVLFASVSLSAPMSAWLLLLPMAAFLVDAALTLVSRMLRGEQWWTPHVQHCYQHCVQRGHPHRVVTAGYLVFSSVAVCLPFMLLREPTAFIIGVIATWYALAAAVWFCLRIRHRRWMAATTGMIADE